jgi:hypothetical protein
VRGALGYAIPGSSFRIEVGGSYAAARGSQSQLTTTTTQDVSAQLLDGSGRVAFTCAGSFTCTTSGALSTNYAAWEANAKVARELKLGAAKLTPSAAVFAGNARTDQSLTQAFTQVSGAAVTDTGTYAASTSLHWTDIGGRVGIDLALPLTNALTLGTGGWVGMAARHATLSGSDTASSTPVAIFNGNSAISTGADVTTILANVEAGLALQVTSMITLRGFAGVDWDNRVPGISIPSFTGSVNAPTATTPAGIHFNTETSIYAGGGFKVKL